MSLNAFIVKNYLVHVERFTEQIFPKCLSNYFPQIVSPNALQLNDNVLMCTASHINTFINKKAFQ